MQIADFTSLRYAVDDGVARVTLDRPGRRNAFTSRLYDELKWAIRRADADPGVRAIVLTGAGAAFAAGGDLAEVAELLADEDPLAMYAFFDALPYEALRTCGTTTIAAVNGACYAGGLIVAALCDISVAASSATFALAEATVGLADAIAPSLLFGRVPTTKLKYLLLTGAAISADRAERWGLVTEVVEDHLLDGRVDEILSALAATAPSAQRAFKRYLAELQPRPQDATGVEAFARPEASAGIRAYLASRAVR